MTILIIDDEPGLRQTVSLILAEEGYQVHTASDGEEGLARARELDPDLILCDVRMPRLPGLEFLDKFRAENGRGMVVVMTAYGGLELAVEAMKHGAYDYLPKPFSPDQLVLTIKKAEEREALRTEVKRLREEVQIERRYREIIAKAPAMTRALEVAFKVARHPSPVLITGESGTGKELVARLIHAESDRADGPFVPINCGAIPETLLESEMFGYVKGAFTGADRDKQGLFEAASGGTLFLDEIGEMSPALQVKLLRVLQESQVRRVGDTRVRNIDVRLISATNKNLEERTRQGEFRSDLYYRVAVVPIHLVPLRQRKEEVPLLVRHFMEQNNRRLHTQISGIDQEAMQHMLHYAWPGNVRELENTIERALVLAEGPRITPADLPTNVTSPLSVLDGVELPDDELSVKKHGAVLERRLIRMALERTGGNKTRASELLELSSRALLYKIREYGLG